MEIFSFYKGNNIKEPIIKNKKKISKLVFFVLMLFSFLIGGILVGGFISIIQTLPEISAIDDYNNSKYWALPTKVFSEDGKLLANFGIERREIVKINHIPDYLIKAIIAVEDVRFYKHRGIDLRSIIRAAWKNLLSLSAKEGGSTITQQLVRNLLLSEEKTLKRKLQEIILAMMIEMKYTKEEILEKYLNKIYFGYGRYGVEAASLFYFGKHVWEIDLCEAAILAAIPKNPSKFSPFNNPKLAGLRQKIVLEKMVEAGFIEKEEAQIAALQFSKKVKNILKTTPKGNYNNPHAYFVEYIRHYLEKNYGADLVYKGGLKVYTTLDTRIQQVADNVLKKHLLELNERRKKMSSKWSHKIEGSVLIMHPLTGYVKAVVGGSGYSKVNQLNRALQIKRQPGSAFKPLIYATALEDGAKPSDILIDAPVKYIGAAGKIWEPQNYDSKFRGRVTLTEALQDSINVATIKLLEKIGSQKVISLARSLGIESYLEDSLALGLGTSKVSPVELTISYSAFVNGGYRVKPIFIKCIRDRYDKLLEENKPQLKKALSEEIAYIMMYLLNRVVSYGTGREAYIGYSVGGKTGTTQNFADAWFVGFCSDLTICIWIGCDGGNISLGDKWAGGVVAAPVFRKILLGLKDYLTFSDFKVPTNIEFHYIDLDTGLLATDACINVVYMPFLKDNAPKGYCQLHLGVPYTDRLFFDDEFGDDEFGTSSVISVEEKSLPEQPQEEFEKIPLYH